MKGSAVLCFLWEIQEECGGVIPFERFMQEALHHPVHGYYGSRIRDVGAKGDFSTSATLDPLLGPAIANWIKGRAQEMGWRRIPVIEVGAGNGSLAHSVLRHLGWRMFFRTDYRIVESSTVLREHQQKRLRWHGVRWEDSLQEALAATGGRALIFSNELADAFPCRLFEKQTQGWQELGVTIHSDGSLTENAFGSVQSDPWFGQFDSLAMGQRVERLDSYQEWLSEWSSFWKEGSFLTIDYGGLAGKLYAGRPGGTLRAYWQHRRFTGREVYARFGRQDLTADVNFTDLVTWGTSLDWETAPLLTQREFLERWLTPASRLKKNSPFLRKGGAGDHFHVLEQHHSHSSLPVE